MKAIYIMVSLVVGLTILLLVRYFVFRLGKAVDEKLSHSYYYHSIKNIIVYAPAGNWFELDYVELEADKESFEPLAEDFGKDDTSIFWKGIKQPVDHASFYIDEEGLAKDSSHVYSKIGSSQELTPIDGANPLTYHRFDTGIDYWNRYWARDDTHYYYLDKKIDADYLSFRRINQTLAIDTNSVFAIIDMQLEDSGRVTQVREVILKSKIPKGSTTTIYSNYALIGNTVILSNWKNEFAMIPFSNIITQQILDDRNIVINGQLISDGKLYPEIDVTTFTVLHRDYFKDKSKVYFGGEVIDSAEPETFEILSDDYAKDSQAVFYKNQKVEGASASGFSYDYATGLGYDGTKKFKEGKLITAN